MPKPQKPTSLYVTNGWYLEIPGLVSPHFETMEGVTKEGGTVSIIDGGRNREYKFSDQIMKIGDVTLTRTKQGTSDDIVLNNLVERMILNGISLNIRAVKMHNGVEVFSIFMEGFRFKSKALPTWDVNASEKYTETYTATVLDWVEL